MSTVQVYRCFNPDCDAMYTVHGHLSAHMKMKPDCGRWYAHMQEVRAGKQRAREPTIVPGSIHDMTAAHFAPEEGEDDDDDDVPMAAEPTVDTAASSSSATANMDDEDLNEDILEQEEDAARERLLRDWIHNQSEHDDLMVINQPDVAIGQPGPGPTTLRARLGQMVGARARLFDDEADDTKEVVEQHPTAGIAISMSSQLYERWDALFGAAQLPKNERMDGSGQPDLEGLYHPFASKLDWDVAQWMVGEGIGHGSFNRLLQIEGLRERLGLSYKHAVGLHERVDAIPRRAGQWYDKHITFPDRPDEVFILRHRDILECVDALIYGAKAMSYQHTHTHQTLSSWGI